MAGIYLHIPFCRRACHYCDFHFSTNLARSSEMVDALLHEMTLRHDYLGTEQIDTIYFGGGTPSLLPSHQIERILRAAERLFSIADRAEITLEANPEDLTREKLNELRAIGVNRLSLGTQSFVDSELKWMNRMHTAQQAIESVKLAQQIGFDNISIDLIFGLPDQRPDHWQHNLRTAISLHVQHISSYSLTVEPRTVLSNRIAKGKQQPPEEEAAVRFFEMNMSYLPENGFEQYEISNYGQPGFFARHNTSYWTGASYLGLGPSAHSFNGHSRQWNIRSNAAYLNNLAKGSLPFEKEVLTVSDRLNEHIMTGLRTKWGIQRDRLEVIDPSAWQQVHDQALLLDTSEITVTDTRITLTDKGKLKADGIAASLFV